MDTTSVKVVNRGLFLNISSNAIGALSKESAERILKRRDTNEIHQLMYVPIENDNDLKWLVHSLHQIIMNEKDVHVVLELADLLYFFIVPFYKEELVSRGELSYMMNDILFILDLWTNQDLIELVDAIQFELKRVERKGL
ncbi:hypothetical protein [Bacillus pumilus]|uniref:Uncharacterized protein n=1 Tax=Bacillus pumilus TaxID=1408 RepID=A0AAD0MKD4_BACPU|nr:hypothetical protein [Bacillus pumilus]AVM22858.1 hypothetical protein C5695_03000 [Bacillus pumilus]TYS43308.1 hypothetical protein FZC68_04320 [Bacillus pumilus]